MIHVFQPNLTLKDKFSVLKTMSQNNISGTSPTIRKFELELSNKFNMSHAIAVSNGSVALDLALKVLSLKEDDEVILPSHTIISCLSAVVRSNAKPVFCDTDINTWNMRLSDIEKVVTKKTKVVLMVHTYGLPAEAKKIKEYCTKNNILLIEDAAEAHGQYESGQPCGSFGDLSTFSFYANKHITTGEGGAILTNSEVYNNELLKMRNLDFSNKERFKHENLYWNYRLSGLQASLGISQIKEMQNTIKHKVRQGSYYQSLLSENNDIIQLPLKEHNGSENHYWVFGILIKQKNIRNDVMVDLKEKGIETRPFFWPLHLQKALPEKFKPQSNNLVNSENLGENGLYLPLGKHINKRKQKYITKNLIGAIKERS